MNARWLLLKYWALPTFLFGLPLSFAMPVPVAFAIAGTLGFVVGILWFMATQHKH